MHNRPSLQRIPMTAQAPEARPVGALHPEYTTRPNSSGLAGRVRTNNSGRSPSRSNQTDFELNPNMPYHFSVVQQLNNVIQSLLRFQNFPTRRVQSEKLLANQPFHRLYSALAGALPCTNGSSGRSTRVSNHPLRRLQNLLWRGQDR